MGKRFDPNSVSDEELLESIRRLSKKLNRTPSQTDMKHGDSNTKRLYLYRRRFGSIKNAQVKAGMEPNNSGTDIKYSSKQLIDEINTLSKKLNRTPSQTDIS